MRAYRKGISPSAHPSIVRGAAALLRSGWLRACAISPQAVDKWREGVRSIARSLDLRRQRHGPPRRSCRPTSQSPAMARDARSEGRARRRGSWPRHVAPLAPGTGRAFWRTRRGRSRRAARTQRGCAASHPRPTSVASTSSAARRIRPAATSASPTIIITRKPRRRTDAVRRRASFLTQEVVRLAASGRTASLSVMNSRMARL